MEFLKGKMKNKYLYLVCFDIVNDKTRYRAAKCLLKYGTRVQKSVFECILDARQFVKMKSELEKIISFEQDSVRYYLLCKRCEENIAISGLGTFTLDEYIIIV